MKNKSYILIIISLSTFILFGWFTHFSRYSFFEQMCKTYKVDDGNFDGEVGYYILDSVDQCISYCDVLYDYGVENIYFKGIEKNSYYIFEGKYCQYNGCSFSYSEVESEYVKSKNLFDWFYLETELLKEESFSYDFFVTKFRFYEREWGSEIYRKYKLSMDTSGVLTSFMKYFIGGVVDHDECWSDSPVERFKGVPFVKG
tara:strand:+ start:934 stop:1533 length:600 start_codon:yes stop_codon:yes gene_type:complete